MSIPAHFTRRRMLGASAALGAAAVAAPAIVLSKSPNEKLNIACVGVGGRAAANIAGCADENIVALCDVDEKILERGAKKHAKAKTYVDFRKMLSELEKHIDAVLVGTPDHIHAPAGLMAMRMGKHTYCEKPLAHDVYQVRQMSQVAGEKKLATQMGTQIHAEPNYRRVVELVRAGAIGPVSEVHVWCGKGWGGGTRPTEAPPVPKNIHWDLWLGPAPERPYHPCYLPANWRRWWDFGNGTLGDMACHLMDLPFWALKLRHPTTIEAEGPPVDKETCPTKLIVRYDFPAADDRPAVKLTWYDGGYQPQLPSGSEVKLGGMGVLFVGKEGMLRADYGSRQLFPVEKFKEYKAPPETVPPSIGHHQEWIEACKNGSPTTCNFDYSGALAEAVLLGTVAYRTQRKLQWDAANLKAVNCPEADALIRQPSRPGWGV
jgi:predicted dehydrogenase